MIFYLYREACLTPANSQRRSVTQTNLRKLQTSPLPVHTRVQTKGEGVPSKKPRRSPNRSYSGTRPKAQAVLRETKQPQAKQASQKRENKETRQQNTESIASQRNCVNAHRKCSRITMGALPRPRRCMTTGRQRIQEGSTSSHMVPTRPGAPGSPAEIGFSLYIYIYYV